jgi:hypothetical protein
VTTVDGSGNVVQRHIFDAWGKLENYDQNESDLERPVVNLGYTGHEAEDTFGISQPRLGWRNMPCHRRLYRQTRAQPPRRRLRRVHNPW